MEGSIVQVSGSVVDVRFDTGLPKLREALKVEVEGKELVMEVASHIGNSLVRCIMLAGSEGLARGMKVIATGNNITVPVGECTLGRMFNVLGEPIDGKGEVAADAERWAIHRKAPSFEDQSPAIYADANGC